MEYKTLTLPDKIATLLEQFKSGKIGLGRYATIHFKSEYDYKGHHLLKESKGVVRIGIDYMSNFHQEGAQQRTNNFVYIIDKILKFNTKTQKYSLNCFTTRKDNSVKAIYYELDGQEVSKEIFDTYKRPSAPSDKETILFTINLNNLIALGE